VNGNGAASSVRSAFHQASSASESRRRRRHAGPDNSPSHLAQPFAARTDGQDIEAAAARRGADGCAALEQSRIAFRDAARLAAEAQSRRKMSEPLVPPKPKELDNAYSRRICRACLGT
jgi:hypothetical protein